MIKYLKNNLLFIYLIINILFVFTVSVLDTYVVYDLNILSSWYLYAFILNLIICLIIIIYKRFIKKNYKLEIIDLVLLLMIIFGCISTIYAIRSDVAWNGLPIRREGLYTIIYYYTLFFLTKFTKKANRKSIIYVILTIGIFEVFYGCMQKVGANNVSVAKVRGAYWVYGTFLNPNFFSSFMVLCIGYAIGLYYDTDDNYYKVFFGLLSLFYCFGLILCYALSGFVALVCIITILMIHSFIKKKLLKIIILGLLIVILALGMNHFKITHLFGDLEKAGNQVVEMEKGNYDDSYASGRFGIWKKTFNVMPKYIWHGSGIDNYPLMFKTPLYGNDGVIDKAHNEYIQILATEGIFALIAYLLFYVIILIKGRKKQLYYILPVIGYLIQAFFNISVTSVAPFFFISLGLLYFRD